MSLCYFIIFFNSWTDDEDDNNRLSSEHADEKYLYGLRCKRRRKYTIYCTVYIMYNKVHEEPNAPPRLMETLRSLRSTDTSCWRGRRRSGLAQFTRCFGRQRGKHEPDNTEHCSLNRHRAHFQSCCGRAQAAGGEPNFFFFSSSSFPRSQTCQASASCAHAHRSYPALNKS